MGWRILNPAEVAGGALPHRQWIKEPSDKKHRLSYRFKYRAAEALNKQKYNERLANAYADWLMARDGIVQPEGTSREIVWNVVAIGAKYERRIEAVAFGSREKRFNHHKDGRRGAYLSIEFVEVSRITIPNWDWAPTVREETLGGLPAGNQSTFDAPHV